MHDTIRFGGTDDGRFRTRNLPFFCGFFLRDFVREAKTPIFVREETDAMRP